MLCDHFWLCWASLPCLQGLGVDSDAKLYIKVPIHRHKAALLVKQPDAGDGPHNQNALIKPPQLTRERLPHQERINKTIPADAGEAPTPRTH